MKRNKKRLRAQRKFALGAFIPPQNHATSSTPASVAHASHRAVNAPGPVILNSSSARDILTRMSLGKAHPHADWQPVVRIEYDHKNLLSSTQSKKLKDKKTLKTHKFKKKYSLRCRRKGIALNIPNIRRTSVSDSGEDTPLSYLTTRETAKTSSVTASAVLEKQTNTVASEESTTAVESPNTNKVLNRTKPLSVRFKMSTKSVVGATNVRPQNVPVVNVGPRPTTYNLPVCENHSDYTVYDYMANVSESRESRDIELSDKNSEVEEVTSPVSEQDEEVPPSVPRLMTLRHRRPINSYKDPGFPYDSFSETSSHVGSVLDRNSEIEYPAYKASVSTCSSEDIGMIRRNWKRKVNIKKKKRDRVSIKKSKTVANRVITPAVVNETAAADSDFSSVSGASGFHNINCPDINSAAFADDEHETDPLPPNVPLALTADWVRAHYQTESSSSTAPEVSSYTIVTQTNTPGFYAPGCSSSVAENSSLVSLKPTSSKNPSETLDSCFFKMPQIPIRFTKRNKGCPTRLVTNLFDLLNYQATETEPMCNLCKRCILIAEYNKVLSMLPPSKEDELDILHTSTLNIYALDSKDEGLSKLIRGRELVRNVLNTKILPIWLSNVKMNLKRTMFLDEHKLQTLKRNITFESDDIADAMVSKLISRVYYLARCINEDQNELSQPTSFLRSAKSMIYSPHDKKQVKRVTGPRRQRKISAKPKQKIQSNESKSNPLFAAQSSPGLASAPASTGCNKGSSSFEEILSYVTLTPQEKILSAAINKAQRNHGESITGIQSSSNKTQINKMFGESSGVPPTETLVYRPTLEEFKFDGVELDLVKLYHLVYQHGGIEELLAHSEKWALILEQMSLASTRGKLDQKKLEKIYCKYILPYESLSYYDRVLIQENVDRVWSERCNAALRRASRPLHYVKVVHGETTSEDEDEPPSNPETDDVRNIGKPCFDRIEECTAKGRTMNLATFRRIARQIYMMRYEHGPKPTLLDIEDDYWNIIAFGNEHVSVQSAFIDTSVDGLGHTSDPDAPGGSDPWNLKRLSENRLNILRVLGKTLSVTVPTLCLNQVFSTNCWHMDPHNLAWTDYMHEGTTKIWYAVAQSGSQSFRQAVQLLVPSAVQNKGIWLASDTIMIPPGLLTAQGVELQRLEQNPGEFIVVFPGSYASSISTGMTISESIYFQSKIWLNNIDITFQQIRRDCEPTMFSNTLLLLRSAQDPNVNVLLLPRVLNSIKIIFHDEFDVRNLVLKYKCRVTIQNGRTNAAHQPISWTNQEECSVCRGPLILSKTVRYNEPRSLMCLKDGMSVYRLALQPPQCDNITPPPVTLLYTHEEMYQIIRALEERIVAAALPKTSGRRRRSTRT